MAPRFSIITPIYETPIPILERLLDCVRAQTFTDWELCLVDDGSRQPHIRRMLGEAAAADARIRVQHRTENGGIVAGSNDALAMATGEFVALLDHDDELVPHALERMDAEIAAAAATGTDDVDYLYSDEDKIDEHGTCRDPFFKPDWSPERFRCQMYTCHFSVIRRTLVEEVGGFREDYNGSQDFDLVFRVTEQARRIVHVPEVLYHWRIMAGSAAGDAGAKPYAWLAGQRAIQSHCDRTGFEAEVEHTMDQPGWYHLRPRLRDEPSVSIVIPTNGTRRRVLGLEVCLVEQCVESIVERSTYDRWELVVVADTDTPDATLDRLDELAGDRLTVVPYDRPFNFADKINTGACRTEGEHLLILNDDTEVITPEWIESLLMYSRAEHIGAVGPRLLFGDGRIQHAGIVNTNDGPSHAFYGMNVGHPGYFNAAGIPGNYLAVTAAAMMTPHAVFDEVGGFCVDFPSSYNDVDYCFKVATTNHRVAYNPEVTLHHYESSSRVPQQSPADYDLLRRRWGHLLDHDPFLNPNLLRTTPNFLHAPYLPDGRLLHA